MFISTTVVMGLCCTYICPSNYNIIILLVQELYLVVFVLFRN